MPSCLRQLPISPVSELNPSAFSLCVSGGLQVAMVASEMTAKHAERVVRTWSTTPSGVLILTHEKFRDWGE